MLLRVLISVDVLALLKAMKERKGWGVGTRELKGKTVGIICQELFRLN